MRAGELGQVGGVGVDDARRPGVHERRGSRRMSPLSTTRSGFQTSSCSASSAPHSSRESNSRHGTTSWGCRDLRRAESRRLRDPHRRRRSEPGSRGRPLRRAGPADWSPRRQMRTATVSTGLVYPRQRSRPAGAESTVGCCPGGSARTSGCRDLRRRRGVIRGRGDGPSLR